MSNKAIPFRPRLEGYFRSRFYITASKISADTTPQEIEALVEQEVTWVEMECSFNTTQRRRYRAIWLLFRDLIRASWKACYRDGVLEMQLPSLDTHDKNNGSTPEVKALLRGWMQDSRHERLVTYKEFIARMETSTASRGSILQLVADGDELATRMAAVINGETAIEQAVQPYLQLVEENVRDEDYSGQKLSDIWRYFRLTWSTPAETTPGRTMQYLIRDAAHPNHAVMGIASLENCAVQITCRDDYIGWNPTAFIENIKTQSTIAARDMLLGLLQYLADGIEGIAYENLCTEKEINEPTDDSIQSLFQQAEEAEELRQQLLKAAQEDASPSDEEKSELGSISVDTERALYLRKRAEQLARLLSAKKTISSILKSNSFDQAWHPFVESETGYSAIRTALIAQKGKHIGSSMMELNVCGAIPPYNEILGGKLVALLALSPQVISDYKKRYSNRESEIASRLKGEAVHRAADLVYVGTTSLYYVGSSQYNRLRLPAEVLDSDYELRWRELGTTFGFGTMHISKATTMSLTEATSDVGFSRINHVFGEGASPKMRLMTMAIRELLETTQEDTRDLSKHAMSRIVYGVELARNTQEYLLGLDSKPEYYFRKKGIASGTQRIIDYWRIRWVMSRLNFPPLLDRLRAFDREGFLISNELNKEMEWKFEKLEEADKMSITTSEQPSLDFVRKLYRGSSAFADKVADELLDRIHVETSLDSAILEAVAAGKDVILTGNPGDGKTHLIRVIKEKLDLLPQPPYIELDASCLSNLEIREGWETARRQGIPFVLAINAAVLFSLAEHFADFSPIKSACQQMIHATVYSLDQPDDDNGVVVYDLSKREVLATDVVLPAITKITRDENYVECETCQFKTSCDALKHKALLQNTLFQERLCIVLSRVALQGHHATLRELLSFLSFLIFGNRSCNRLTATTGENQFDLATLIYKGGSGAFFEAVRAAFDPALVSHPIWDEALLTNTLDRDTWVDFNFVGNEVIDVTNTEFFELRKRQFFFFNNNGSALLDISDDDVSRYQQFLSQDDKKCIKELIKKLNAFFGVNRPNSELEIWGGYRYNNAPRRVLLSVGKMSTSQFSIGRPMLIRSMNNGIKISADHLRLEKKGHPGIFLKVNYELYCLLIEAERGVPMLFMENDTVKRVWRFVEQLQATEDTRDIEEITVALLDVQAKREFRVHIDRDSKRYISIEQTKGLS